MPRTALTIEELRIRYLLEEAERELQLERCKRPPDDELEAVLEPAGRLDRRINLNA